MFYLLNNNYLPWCDFYKKFKDTEYEFKDFLRERLGIKYTKEVFQIIPKDLREMFKKVFTLQFDEEPPYEYIINSIKGEMKNGEWLQIQLHRTNNRRNAIIRRTVDVGP
jgi:hypothetical protein